MFFFKKNKGEGQTIVKKQRDFCGQASGLLSLTESKLMWLKTSDLIKESHVPRI